MTRVPIRQQLNPELIIIRSTNLENKNLEEIVDDLTSVLKIKVTTDGETEFFGIQDSDKIRKIAIKLKEGVDMAIGQVFAHELSAHAAYLILKSKGYILN